MQSFCSRSEGVAETGNTWRSCTNRKTFNLWKVTNVRLLCSMWWIPEHAQENGTKIDVQLIAGHCCNLFEDHIVTWRGHVHRIADCLFDYIYAAVDERNVQCWGYTACELVIQSKDSMRGSKRLNFGWHNAHVHYLQTCICTKICTVHDDICHSVLLRPE